MSATVTAEPYTAKLCPACDQWIYVDAAPYAENDRTKPLRDLDHYDREHGGPTASTVTNGALVQTFPLMSWNTTTVTAVLEDYR